MGWCRLMPTKLSLARLNRFIFRLLCLLQAALAAADVDTRGWNGHTAAMVPLGLGRIAALCGRSSALHQSHSHIRCRFF